MLSNQGEIVSSCPRKSLRLKIKRAQIACVHVVPHLGGVQMKMSPSRGSYAAQRLVSVRGPV